MIASEAISTVDDEVRAAASVAGREFIKLRRRVEGTCTECGNPFIGYVGKRYCSPRCQIRAWRRSKRQVVSESKEDQKSGTND